MTRKLRLIHRNVLDSGQILFFLIIGHTVDKQKRVAMWQKFLNLSDVHSFSIGAQSKILYQFFANLEALYTQMPRSVSQGAKLNLN
jgi:hypothetical protein